MYHSDWELAVYVRNHIASLADEHRACAPIDQGKDRPPHLVTQLRHRLGTGLIQLGRALAGSDAVRGLPAPPGRPAPSGHPGS